MQHENAEALIRKRYQGRRILVVDDEKMNLEIAQLLLEKIGLIVDTADDGLIAVQRVKDSAYPIILMDMQMPNLNSLQAIRQIRALSGYKDIAIVAMSANAFTEEKVSCKEADMNDFIAKPFDPDVLFSKLLWWLDQTS